MIWRFTEVTDAVVIKAAVGGIKTHPLGSHSSQAHRPAVLMRLPCASSFLQTGQHNSEEIFHDIKEYRESCRTAGARNENKLSDLIQTVTYFFQERSIAQVVTENGAACRGPVASQDGIRNWVASASPTMPTVRVHAVGVC